MDAKEKRILTVLRSGGDFLPQHVQALQRQLQKWAPQARLICLSDVDVPGVETAPLLYMWPGWWSKMEFFRPDLQGDFLTTDLDNVFLGPLGGILSVREYTTQTGECNALAYLTEEVRALVWKEWIRDPERHMRDFDPRNAKVSNSFGDGGFIKSLIHAEQHWEALFPGQLANIADLGIIKHGVPWAATIRREFPKQLRVLFCWRPWRPWKLPLPALRRLYLY